MIKLKKIVKSVTPSFVFRIKSKFSGTSTTSKGCEQDHNFYDQQFLNEERWKQHYSLTGYYPLWSVLVDRLRNTSIDSVLSSSSALNIFTLLNLSGEFL